jgi:hypothetical protein
MHTDWASVAHGNRGFVVVRRCFSDVSHLASRIARSGSAFRFLTVFGSLALLASFPAAAIVSTVGVGATAGNFAVGPSGAATYTIPVAIAPGTNGMQPTLSLNYSSQSGNDLLGHGWSLGGLSVIHRCGATIATDGVKGGVTYNAGDRFCLDGERLIAIGGANTAHSTNRGRR